MTAITTPSPTAVATPPRAKAPGFLAWLLGRREQSPAERAEAELARRMKAKQDMLDTEARECMRELARLLKSHSLFHRMHTGRNQYKEKLVRFMPVDYGEATEEALYLPVDLRSKSRPEGVSVKDLADPDLLEDLSVSIGRKITARYSSQHGFVFIVWRNEGANGIPLHVKYDDMIALRPANLGPMGFPLGQGEGKKTVWRDLSKLPSILIAGTTGGGKSNALNCILGTLITNNSPRDLQIALVDLKRVELSPYKHIPHIFEFTALGEKAAEGDDPPKRRAFCVDADDVQALFLHLRHEMFRRTELLERAGVNDITYYNRRNRRNKLPYLYYFIDELLLVTKNPDVGKMARPVLAELLSVGRALGMGGVLATQYPNSDVLDSVARAVLPATMSFNMPTIASSVAILGSKKAFKISDTRGRFIWQHGSTTAEIQAPFLPPDIKERLIEMARSGTGYAATLNEESDVSDNEILMWAAVENRGLLSERTIADQFGYRNYTLRDARKLAERYAGRTVELEGEDWMVLQASPGRAARLVRLGDTVDAENAVNIVDGGNVVNA